MRTPARANSGSPLLSRRSVFAGLLAAASMIAPGVCAQSPQAASAGASSFADAHPIAIVPLDNGISGHAFEVKGDLQVSNGRASIAANGSIAAGNQSARVTLPSRGTLLVCAYTTVKLTAASGVPSGEVPGLMLAIEHGALEMSFAPGRANTRNADFLLTPDFRILIGTPGAADVQVRLGPKGDTCVDNAGASAPYVLVSSLFDGGAYRVLPGQRVMFQHGSLHEVVDQEKESCGCPPEESGGNEFPVAQSERLALNPVPNPPAADGALVYKSADHAPQAAEPAPNAASAPPNPAPPPKPGFFGRVGRFFKRIFGAE